MSNGLDPDHDRGSVGPDLVPNGLQSEQQTIKFAASRRRVIKDSLIHVMDCKLMLSDCTNVALGSIRPLRKKTGPIFENRTLENIDVESIVIEWYPPTTTTINVTASSQQMRWTFANIDL